MVRSSNERHDPAFGLVPLVERAVAAPESGIADRDGNEGFEPSPCDPETISPDLELRHFGNMDGKGLGQANTLQLRGNSATPVSVTGCIFGSPNTHTALPCPGERVDPARGHKSPGPSYFVNAT